MPTPPRPTDVIVVGAGPVGLLLAGELRLAGASVVVLERLREPTGESRASQLNARTMEILDQRGLLDRIDKPGWEGRGHFGGLPLDVHDVDSRHAGHWKIPQYRTEAALERWATELGARLLRGCELAGLEEEADAVVAVADLDGDRIRVAGRYLVGCDGEDSTVRHLAGFPVRAQPARRELLRADVRGVRVPDRRFQRLERGLAIAATRDGVTRVMMHEYGRAAAPRQSAPPFDEIVATWARITGEDIGAGTLIWSDAFDDGSCHAGRYRQGRVLLAGDAAHRMMPIGGQALNVGLQDAVNLGWKLGAETRGWAPPGLLDTYHDERHPVGARVLAAVEAQKVLQLDDQRADGLRLVLGELLGLAAGRRHVAAMVSGLDVRYPADPGDPLAGSRMPARELRTAAGSSDVATLLRAARGILLDCTGGGPEGDALRAAAAPWRDRVDSVTATPAAREPGLGCRAALLRPDGHIAWADGDPDSLRDALRRWFGDGRL